MNHAKSAQQGVGDRRARARRALARGTTPSRWPDSQIAMVNAFTSAGIEEAASKQSGPFYSWLRRVREGGGDQDLRRFALEVLRTCPASHGELSPELVDRLAAFVDDPALGSSALRPWMASDVWIWREIAKIAFEWGGAARTGDSLVRQVAVVVHWHLLGCDPAPVLDAVCERLPRLPDAFDLDGAMFEIVEARGDILQKLLGYADDPDHPQKLLVQLRSSGWRTFFLSAFVGHWDGLTEEDRKDLHRDYALVPLVDYGAVLDLCGATVVRVSGARARPDGTQIVLEFDRGTFTLGEMDPRDPHSDSYYRWAPRMLT